MTDAVLDTTFQPGDPVYYRGTNGKRAFIVGRIVAVDAPQRFPIRNNCSCATTRRLAFIKRTVRRRQCRAPSGR